MDDTDAHMKMGTAAQLWRRGIKPWIRTSGKLIITRTTQNENLKIKFEDYKSVQL